MLLPNHFIPAKNIKNDSSGLEVRLNVVPNFELKQLILSFGKNVKVIRPANWSQLISNELKNAASHFDE